MRILGIESSCDETAAAVVEDGRRVLSSVIASQVEEHKLYGGVVPEIASRRPSEGAVELGTRGQTSAPPPRRGDGAELSAAVGPNPNSAQTVTLRSESIFDSSPGMTRLTPSPKAVSSTRTPLTSEANSRGSIDAD